MGGRSSPLLAFRTRLWSRRLERDPVLRVLHAQPLFRELTLRELQRLKTVHHARTYDRGELLFEAGQPGAAVFVVLSGRVSVVLPDADTENEVEVAVLERGAFVGELALLDDSPRSASVRALEATEAVAFFRGDLERLFEEQPAMGHKVHRALARVIGRRLRATNAQLSASERARLADSLAALDDEDPHGADVDVDPDAADASREEEALPPGELSRPGRSPT